MVTQDETEEEDSGMTYKRLFELRSRIGKSMTTFQKEFKERKKTVKVGIKKMQVSDLGVARAHELIRLLSCTE